jgi:hypothetical protein
MYCRSCTSSIRSCRSCYGLGVLGAAVVGDDELELL